MSKSKKTVLLVITPDSGRDCVFNILNAETGEGLASHFCSNESFASSDLYYGRPERIKEWTNRFGKIEVKFLKDSGLTKEELIKRNKEWYKEYQLTNKQKTK